MEATSLRDVSQALGGLYVPQFEVRVQGSPLPGEVVRDVLRVRYVDSLDAVDQLQLTVNNWDETARALKYLESDDPGPALATAASAAAGPGLYDVFTPCAGTVEMSMGYLESLTRMFRGEVTTLAPAFPSSGPPTLTVRALSELHQYQTEPHTRSWEDLTDSEIAQAVGRATDRRGRRQLELDVCVSPQAQSQEEARPYVAQQNLHDVDFLLGLARRNGYELVLERDEGGEFLYFGPPVDDPGRCRSWTGAPNAPGPARAATPPTYELRWGATLLEIEPTLTTASQVRSVTVRGWDRRRKRAISETKDLSSREVRTNQDLHDLVSRCAPRQDIVVDEPVHTVRQARQRALAILQDRQREMVTATGTTVGLPELRSGRTVQISGLGRRLSGAYLLTQTTHTIDDGGYRTQFEARREDPAAR